MSKLTPELLLRAYAVGLFPMAERRDDPTLYWIDPEKRGVLALEDFHVPRRLRRPVRHCPFEVRCDSAFPDVIRRCAEAAPARRETWINEEIARLYGELFEMGRAHSVECWKDDALVGGLYGVALGGAFFGESMFSRATDASKVALVHLVARLKQGGFSLLDTQFVTPHLGQFGVVEVARAGYRVMLARALETHATFQRALGAGELESFLQSTTQMS